MRLNATAVRAAACGRWPAILANLGIKVPPHRKHGPCPRCGGKDRCRFDDKGGRGTWFCNQCDPKAGDGFDLVKNVRGCSFSEALQLVGGILGVDATIPDRRHRRQPLSKPIPVDRRAVAFQFELAALDLRLRAGRIVQAAKNLTLATLDDHELDQAIGLVAQAYADQDRAELFEGVADTLRARAFTERKDCERRTRVA